ncbi:MAG TPA: ABC transporter permease [Candidatus Limnocylindria bacterium]|nr:ABC transporter permease [Candidatus Limnocylindria bacterium]
MSISGLWRRRALLAGLTILSALLLFGVVGALVVDRAATRIGSGPFGEAPSAAHPLGTDTTGRDMLALVVHATPATLEVGLLAGAIGTLVGTILGLVSGYYRGPVDTLIRSVADVALTIPALAVLVVLAAFLQTTTLEVLAVIVALFAWPSGARAIRAQTLTLRERDFVALAKVSGASDIAILFTEILPNLLPFVVASFIGAVSGAIVAAVGLQLLGLGPLNVPSLGMILQFAFQYAALSRGMWWWWGPPTLVLVLLFVGLFLVSTALDEIANPRLRRSMV